MFKTEKRILYLGIIIEFILGCLFHFGYDLLKNPIVGLICPINESVWEHSKLIIYPIMIWFLVLLFKIPKEKRLQWLTTMLVTIVLSIFIMFFLFYFYTQAFGIEKVWIDIVLFFITLCLGNLIGAHYYTKGKPLNLLSIIIFIVILIFIYTLFTFKIPNLPIFKSKV